MLCASGLKSVAMGYQAIKNGDSNVVVAGGQESMSRVSKFLTHFLICIFCRKQQIRMGKRDNLGIIFHITTLKHLL